MSQYLTFKTGNLTLKRSPSVLDSDEIQYHIYIEPFCCALFHDIPTGNLDTCYYSIF